MGPLKKRSKDKSYPRIVSVSVKLNSTIVCLYEGEDSIFSETLWYSNAEMKKYISIDEQVTLRAQSIISLFKNKKLYFDEIDALVCRGVILQSSNSGTYVLNGALISALDYYKREDRFTEDLFLFTEPLLCYELSKTKNVNAYMVTTVNIDEMMEEAKLTGIKGIKRDSYFNALTQKTVAKRFCRNHNKQYEKTNLIVAYLGNPMTIAAHKLGNVIEVNNTSQGEGPFSPETTGSLPMGDLIKMCFSGNFIYEEIEEIIESRGGCMAYFGYKDFRILMDNVQRGDEPSKKLFNAMAYNICKEIGKCSIALQGKIYGIVLTGRISHCKPMVDYIRNRVGALAPIYIYAGKEEMTNLVEEVLRVIRGDEKEILWNGGGVDE